MQSIEPDRVKPGKTPDLDASKQSSNSEKARHSPVVILDKASKPELRVADLQGPAPDFEPVREVTASPDRCRMLPLLVWTHSCCFQRPDLGDGLVMWDEWAPSRGLLWSDYINLSINTGQNKAGSMSLSS